MGNHIFKYLVVGIIALLLLSAILPPLFLRKTDANESIYSWSTRFGGTDGDSPYAVTFDGNGNLIFASYITGNADLNGDGDMADSGESPAGYGLSDGAFSQFNQNGEFQWAKRVGGTNNDFLIDIKTDSVNNIYVGGYFLGNIDLNSDGDSLDAGESGSGYGNQDNIIASYTSAGSLRWAKRIGGASNDQVTSVFITADNKVVLLGKVNGNADLNGDGDTSDSGESAAGYGFDDAFVSVFDTDGVFQWAKRFGGTNNDSSIVMTSDLSNSVIVSGYVVGNADLNGDGDTADSGESGTGYGNFDIFVSSFNSSGTFQWAKRFGSSGADFSSHGFKTDLSGNIYLTARLNGNADLNGDGDNTDGGAESARSAGDNDVVILSLDSLGSPRWSKRLGSFANDAAAAYGLVIDSQNNVSVAGTIDGDADLNGDAVFANDSGETSAGYGNNDNFISSFDSSGTYRWSKRLGGSGANYEDNAYQLIADGSNNIYLIGYVDGDADLNGDGDTIDGRPETAIDPADTTADAFVSVFDSNGYFQWANRFGGSQFDESVFSAIDTSGNLIVMGDTIGSADLNGDGDSTDGVAETGVGYGSNDVFAVYYLAPITTSVLSVPSIGPVTIQIPGISGLFSSNLVIKPIRDSATAEQGVMAIIQPNTFSFDAYLSAVRTSPINLGTTSSSVPPSSTSSNTVQAGGGDEAILGVRLSNGISWQIGKVQEIWYKTYPPEGTSYQPAKIIPELQSKPSIIVLSYKDSDLIPPGQAKTKFSTGSLKIAHSADGKNWKRLTSVVDSVNRTVATINKVGGYYMIVSR